MSGLPGKNGYPRRSSSHHARHGLGESLSSARVKMDQIDEAVRLQHVLKIEYFYSRRGKRFEIALQSCAMPGGNGGIEDGMQGHIDQNHQRLLLFQFPDKKPKTTPGGAF